jgi:hypothetical protein
VRLTPDEFEAIKLWQKNHGHKNITETLRVWLEIDLAMALMELDKCRKKAEAKAKRLAKKEAANGL